MKWYPRVEALIGISLSVPTGEIWGLLGPNGSGKSTFLKCIAVYSGLKGESW